MQRKFSSLCVCTLICRAAVPTPREHLGFTPGDDYKLADTAQIFGYFQKLAAASDRIRLVEFGKSSLGKPMYIAFISDAGESAQARPLARNQPAPGAGRAGRGRSARARGAKARPSSGSIPACMRAKSAPAQQAPELAWRMVTGEDAETAAIRQNVILLQMPVINPDGLDWIAHWYLQNVGTPTSRLRCPGCIRSMPATTTIATGSC